MTLDETLALVDKILAPDRLSDVQEVVFRHCWNGQTYQEIADSSGYDADYIRGIGSRLWQLLSQATGEKVTKTNFRSVLRQHGQTSDLPELAPAVFASVEPPEPVADLDLDFPRGPVAPDSAYYVERPPIESLGFEALKQPGGLIRIESLPQMGKTSLMVHLLDMARQQGWKTVVLSLKLAEVKVLVDSRRFLQWVCATAGKSLGLPNRLDQYWDDILGSNYNCTDYFESYLLPSVSSPVVLAIDDAEAIFDRPQLAGDVFALLRAWHERAKYGDTGSGVWRQLRSIVVYATSVNFPVEAVRSPLNVGVLLELREFTLAQVRDLAMRLDLHWENRDSDRILGALMALVGGNPYRVKLALYYLSRGEVTLAQLLQQAATDKGIYAFHLQELWRRLQQSPEWLALFHSVVSADEAVSLPGEYIYLLQSMGLIRWRDRGWEPSCHLYRVYFRDRFRRLHES